MAAIPLKLWLLFLSFEDMARANFCTLGTEYLEVTRMAKVVGLPNQVCIRVLCAHLDI